MVGILQCRLFHCILPFAMNIKLRFFYYITIIFLLNACQQEESLTIDASEGIATDAPLSKLLQNVATHDGSFDDIVDHSNCFSINLPYSILKNNTLLLIDDIDDYFQIESNDDIEIIYPITVTTEAHKEIYIEDQITFNNLSNRCIEDDEDIECIDFLYPIKISLFNTQRNSIQTMDMNHDRQFYNFIEALDPGTLLRINYPISLQLFTSERIDANHDLELTDQILGAIAICDEND